MEDYENSNRQLAIVAAVIFLVILVSIIYWVFENFLKDSSVGEFEGHRQAEYCREVHRYVETNGKEGWPDYQNIYYKSCLNELNKKKGLRD